jgi:predicted TIM-barrel fold metal-dependent hydrolase
MSVAQFASYRPIDTDTHVLEPADLWTARLPSKWREQAPQIMHAGDREIWVMAGKGIGAPGAYAMAGWDGVLPDFPNGYADVVASAGDPHARLAYMDAEGIYAAVLYPNVGGFSSDRFISAGDPELALACVRAYNDFLIEWASADPARLLPVLATPFWDVAATVKEIERGAALGHRAIVFCGQPQLLGQPTLGHRHWDPVWAAARDTGLSVSFHVGAGDLAEILRDDSEMGMFTNFSAKSALYFMQNASCISELTFGGVCHRFPEVKFVSVESGAGWINFVLEGLDWQWQNGGTHREHPEYALLPSEYFRRQIYGCFWFERAGIQSAIERFPDNLMWETDYPHPTCMAPGPQTIATRPDEYAETALATISDAQRRKVLHDNAAALYRVD